MRTRTRLLDDWFSVDEEVKWSVSDLESARLMMSRRGRSETLTYDAGAVSRGRGTTDLL